MRAGEQQTDLWIPTTELARSPGHPFYDRLNRILAKAGNARPPRQVDFRVGSQTAI